MWRRSSKSEIINSYTLHFFLRDEGHTDGGECYVTFSACTVNLGNGFIPKSGVFSVRTLLSWLTC